jgi:Ankyrin repeats (3 copies)
MQSDPYVDYSYALDALRLGDEAQWQELEQLLEGFPADCDHFIGRRWIINAIDCGSVNSVRWMLTKGVELTFRDEEGYTVLHSALERKAPDKREILGLLLQAGADVNARGVNDWTPAHMAAARGDIESLTLLVQAGADLSARTNIDGYATPLEEAEALGQRKAVEFLKNWSAARGQHASDEHRATSPRTPRGAA